MRAPVLLALLVLLPALSAPASADVGIVRVLAGDTVIADREAVFRDYLVVPPGSTLTIRNATVWLDAARLCTGRTNVPGAYQCRPQLDVQGTLVVQDSVIDSHQWRGDVDNGFTLHVERGTARITGSTLRHYVGITFIQPGPAPSIVEDNEFREGATAIRFMQGATGVFRRNLVEDVREGILVSDATATIERNVFRNVTRDYGASSYHWAVSLTSASPPDHAFPNRAVVRGNLVDNATAGIAIRTGSPNLVEDNVIRNVAAGMLVGVVQDGNLVAREPPVIRRNVVRDAQEGIRVSGHAATETTPDAGSDESLSLRDNVFVDVRCTQLRVLPFPDGVRLTLDASGMWWGTGQGPQDQGPACPALLVEAPTASVTVTPWLRAPPKWVLPLVPELKSA